MLSFRCVRKTRVSLPIPNIATAIFFCSTATTSAHSPPYPDFPQSPTSPQFQGFGEVKTQDVVLSFKEWFKSRNVPLLDHIYAILSADDDTVDLQLSLLNLRLSEPLVLDVLNYRKNAVLSCLKFFDWAGRQRRFNHTRATFNAIFKILSREKLMSLMLEVLENYRKQRYSHKVRFYDTLVMGYAVAGKPETALQLFGRMRFQGIDLDEFSYHVLLNSLVEEGCFDVVEMVAKQIKLQGYENEITHSIMVKCFCRQKQLVKAEDYLHELVGKGVALSGQVVGVLVDALFRNNQFDKAAKILQEFSKTGKVPMEKAYGIWIRDLVQAGKVDGALQFLYGKMLQEGYVPDVFRYNTLVCRLLRENRLTEVCDLLMEMKEREITPDEVTMNAVLCFFCKAGMVDVALELYDSRVEFGLSPNVMAYNFLINTLCGDGSIDDAYSVLKNSIEQGYFPGGKTFSILAGALCREGKLDKMKELFLLAIEKNFMPSVSTYDKFIRALCRASRVEDGYLVHGQLNRLNKITSKNTYLTLISGFNKSSRGDIAARLLLEMQEKGHSPDRELFRAVICCLCDMDNPEEQFLRLLDMQMSRHEPNCSVYNFFIDGAGHAKKPALARQVYEMMKRYGLKPNLHSEILMLQAFLKGGKIADALNFFNELPERRRLGRKLYNTMIVGLCKANRPLNAWQILNDVRKTEMKPSLECYEELVKSLCANEQYYAAALVTDDLVQVGRRPSSFIGNVLLWHSFKTRKLFNSWNYLASKRNLSDHSWVLYKLIGAFSGLITEEQDLENIEELIEECFRLNIFTCNLLLRKLCNSNIDHAYEYYSRLHDKGFEPNNWTYETLIHGLMKHGRTTEARRWMDEMFLKGYEPSQSTKLLA